MNDGYPHLQALSFELEVETLTPVISTQPP